MSTTATNPPVQLGRYQLPTGDRLICGQRILGVVRLTDIPAGGHGRRYLIELSQTSSAPTSNAANPAPRRSYFSCSPELAF